MNRIFAVCLFVALFFSTAFTSEIEWHEIPIYNKDVNKSVQWGKSINGKEAVFDLLITKIDESKDDIILISHSKDKAGTFFAIHAHASKNNKDFSCIYDKKTTSRVIVRGRVVKAESSKKEKKVHAVIRVSNLVECQNYAKDYPLSYMRKIKSEELGLKLPEKLQVISDTPIYFRNHKWGASKESVLSAESSNKDGVLVKGKTIFHQGDFAGKLAGITYVFSFENKLATGSYDVEFTDGQESFNFCEEVRKLLESKYGKEETALNMNYKSIPVESAKNFEYSFRWLTSLYSWQDGTARIALTATPKSVHLIYQHIEMARQEGSRIKEEYKEGL